MAYQEEIQNQSKNKAGVAQLVEQHSCKLQVEGSIPSTGSKLEVVKIPGYSTFLFGIKVNGEIWANWYEDIAGFSSNTIHRRLCHCHGSIADCMVVNKKDNRCAQKECKKQAPKEVVEILELFSLL